MPSFEYVRARSVNEAVPSRRAQCAGPCGWDRPPRLHEGPDLPGGRVVSPEGHPRPLGNQGDTGVSPSAPSRQSRRLRPARSSPVSFPVSPRLPERWRVPSFGTKARSGAISARSRAAGTTAAISIVSGKAATPASPYPARTDSTAFWVETTVSWCTLRTSPRC